MRRTFWWAVAIAAAIIAYNVLAAAHAGAFTESEQLHFVARLVIYGLGAVIVLALFVPAIKDFQASGDFTAWFPLLALLVLIGGAWAWFGYFGDHGAFFIWPVIVGAVFLLLVVVRGLTLERRKKEYADEVRNSFPEPPNNNVGPADRKDFEDWK